MRSLTPHYLFFSIYLTAIAYALRVPLEVRINNASPGRLGRRAPIPVVNTGNAQYSANMIIGGVQVRVLLDTGRSVVVRHSKSDISDPYSSSDLWVNFPGQTPSTTDLGKSVSLDYAIGKAGGIVWITMEMP